MSLPARVSPRSIPLEPHLKSAKGATPPAPGCRSPNPALKSVHRSLPTLFSLPFKLSLSHPLEIVE